MPLYDSNLIWVSVFEKKVLPFIHFSITSTTTNFTLSFVCCGLEHICVVLLSPLFSEYKWLWRRHVFFPRTSRMHSENYFDAILFLRHSRFFVCSEIYAFIIQIYGQQPAQDSNNTTTQTTTTIYVHELEHDRIVQYVRPESHVTSKNRKYHALRCAAISIGCAIIIIICVENTYH